MEKREQLLEIAEAFAASQKDAMIYCGYLEELLEYLLPEKIGKDFCDALAENDYRSALRACAKYYRKKANNSISSLSARGDYNKKTAEDCVKGTVCVINIEWSFPNGDIDYFFDPTAVKGPRNHEWVWQLNRHTEWTHMARAYADTKQERFARAFEKQLLKWIAQTDIPANWNAPGSAWRTIECGIRLRGSWQVAFDSFKHSPSLSDEALLLMIVCMHRQAVHLTKHPTGHNWLMLETNGAYAFFALFDEFADALSHRKIAADRLISELEAQILPDGMQYELSPDYQYVVFRCAFEFYLLAESMGIEKEIPEAFLAQIKKTVDAAVLLSTPAFTQPKTNDTFCVSTRLFTEAAANLWDDATYRFVNSERREGKAPMGDTASVYLPYAGLAVMRSDWSEDASYLCFDVGPLGFAHMHQDMLNIHLFKGDRELIYDDGGGQYEISPIRTYSISAHGHNTVLVDGMPQNRQEPRVYTAPFDASWITNEHFDYAAACYDGTFGDALVKPAVHKREVRFCKPDLFLVCDTLSSADGNEHEYELLFHLDTARVTPLPMYEGGMISQFGGKYEVVILPLDQEGACVNVRTQFGITEGQVQGWYNGRNQENLHAATTLSRHVNGRKDFCFRTLLIPIKKGDALPVLSKDDRGNVCVGVGGKEYRINLHSLHR